MIYWWTPLFYAVLDRRTPLLLNLKMNKVGKQIFFVMSKGFLYYCRISVKEGLDIETEKLHLEHFIDKTIYRKCRICCQLLIIAKNFKEDENTCNSCFKTTSGIDKHGNMHVIWKDNSQYRVFAEKLCPRNNEQRRP